MATSSTVPGVKAALVTLVSAGLSGVSVTYGRPMSSTLPREAVYVGEARGQHRVPVMTSGRKVREEAFTVDVVAAVLAPRGTVQTAEERCFALLAEVEDALADDPSLGGVSGLIHAIAGAFRADPDYANEGPVAVVVLEVDCLARLD